MRLLVPELRRWRARKTSSKWRAALTPNGGSHLPLEETALTRLPKLVGRERQAAVFDCLKRGLLKFFVGEVGEEFLRRVAVVVAGVGPEEFRVVRNLLERGGANALRVRDYGFEYALLPQAEARHLVVDYRVNGDGRLAQVVCENLLSRREVAEAFGLDLKYAGRADALDERRALRRLFTARGRRLLRERGREETEDDCGGE